MLLRGVIAVHTALGLALGLYFASGNLQARIKTLPSAENGKAADEDAFLAARDAASLGNRERFAQLAPRLRNHPLSAYVDFWRLQLRVRNEEPSRLAADVNAFITRNAGTYIADRMRLEWLVLL